MHLKVIACKALLRETCSFVARSEHTIDVEFFGFAFHDEPDKLRTEVQRLVDASEGYDAIALAMGLCGNGCAGLVARSTPLVLPRVDDCIVLLLGSRQRYDRDHSASPGTYYFPSGWLERMGPDGEKAEDFSKEGQRRIRAYYVTRFGEDNADYLLSVLHDWKSSYSRGCLIDSGLVSEGRLRLLAEQAREIAESNGWRYDELPGDPHLIRKLIHGEWPVEDFLIVPPGARIEPSYDGSTVTASALAV